MRKRILFFIMITSSLVNAQKVNEYLNIAYVLNVKLDADKIIESLPKEKRLQYGNILKAEIEKGIYVNYFLTTNGDKSIFKMEEKIDNDPTQVNMVIKQITSLDRRPFIKDIDNKIFYKGYDVAGKLHVVKDSLKNYEWKLSRESKVINGYKAFKAETMLDGELMTAWYSSELKYKDGPDRFWGLPGLILELKYYNKRFDTFLEFKAKSITNEGFETKIKDYSERKYLTEKEFMSALEALNKKYRENTNNGVDVSN